DNTKALKGTIIDWITPKDQHLDPPLHRNIKSTRGFNHPRTGRLLCPAGLNWDDPDIQAKLKTGEIQVTSNQWPIFIYANFTYDYGNPWQGLLHSNLLVQAYKHISLLPSSVDSSTEFRATRSSNTCLHGMSRVTHCSILYIATQVCFALLSQSVFSRTGTVTDLEGFFNTIMESLQDTNDIEETNDLLAWWDL
ncbi:hypothetical protein SERLA73DRAFT_43921, partial [Serpula lacrymans var. lacrymans S7.3]